MTFLKSTLTACAVAFAVPAFAADTIIVTDAYARFMPGAMAGAAFMQIENHGAEPDRLVDVASDIAERVELHTHKTGSDGVMQMMHVPEGFEVPAGGTHALQRGGDHVMFMGLAERPENGGSVTVTLTFEKAGEVTLDIPVDNAR
ncbi:copper chaperone PCu(A)C [Defluviimonas aestuarii]|uniref:copper chaperone PCu(A)C n=1 Tax=Albidovulum aestuarii TaxID=1130726 RepID=UPI00249ABF8F|nr:copper chaperone PCu(A)C [Defluviimonas aestuarii]MDI3336147.1 copper chaperone PCu(A)C [Defluviimonas aestuarii]